VQQALRLRSLDAPLAGGDAAEAPLTLLDVVSEAIAC